MARRLHPLALRPALRIRSGAHSFRQGWREQPRPLRRPLASIQGRPPGSVQQQWPTFLCGRFPPSQSAVTCPDISWGLAIPSLERNIEGTRGFHPPRRRSPAAASLRTVGWACQREQDTEVLGQNSTLSNCLSRETGAISSTYTSDNYLN